MWFDCETPEDRLRATRVIEINRGRDPAGQHRRDRRQIIAVFFPENVELNCEECCAGNEQRHCARCQDDETKLCPDGSVTQVHRRGAGFARASVSGSISRRERLRFETSKVNCADSPIIVTKTIPPLSMKLSV